MEEFFVQVQQILVAIVTHLTDPDQWKAVLSQPGVMVAAFFVLNLIVLMETGLLVFFLPGDSLLVTAGLVGVSVGWPLEWLLITLCLSAIVGDSLGYWIGAKSGPRLFQRDDSWFFKKKYLEEARAFYERHGGKTIIIARFMPFVRTFAPVVAGAAKMEYRRFLSFNVFGGIGWVCSMILLGWYLPTVFNPLLQPIFGEKFRIERNIDILVVIIVALSVAPMVWAAGKRWLKSRSTPRPKVPLSPGATAET